MVKLSDVGKVVTGNTPPTKNLDYYNSNDIAFYKPNDLTKTELSYLDGATVYVSELARPKIRLLPKGSVLVTCIGIIGKVGIALDECTCNQQINAIIPNANKVNNSYLAYCIIRQKRCIQDIANAPIVPIINKTQFSNIEIPLPPLETQKQMAKTLDAAAELVTMRKQQLAELDTLIKSTFYEMFGDPIINEKGWGVVSYSSIITEKPKNGFFAKNDVYGEDGNSEVIWLSDFIDKMYCDLSNLKKVTATEKDIINYEVAYGDMLFCRSSLTKAGIGKCSYVPQEVGKGTLFECHVIKTKVDINKINPIFLQVQSTTGYFRNQIVSNSKTSTMTTIGQEGIVNNLIILPSLSLQTQFASIVTKIEEQKALVKKAIDETQVL